MQMCDILFALVDADKTANVHFSGMDFFLPVPFKPGFSETVKFPDGLDSAQ